MFGIDWNPISWVKSALGLASKVPGDIKRWVVSVVRSAVDTLDKVVKAGLNLVHKDINDVWGGVQSLKREVNRLLDAAGGKIAKVFEDVEHDIDAAVKDSVHGLTTLVDGVQRDADNWYHDAVNFASSAITKFHKDVIDPIVHDLEVSIKDVGKEAEKAADAVYHDVILKLTHDVDKAWTDADKALYWVEHAGYDAVKLVEQSWDILEALSHHPVHELDEALKAWIADFTAERGEKLSEDVSPYYDRVVDAFEDVL